MLSGLSIADLVEPADSPLPPAPVAGGLVTIAL